MRAFGVGQHGGGDRDRPALACINLAKEVLDSIFDRGRQLVRQGRAKVVSGSVVAARKEVSASEFKAYARQSGPHGQDRLEPLRGLRRHAQAHFDPSEEEETLDAAFLVRRLRLLEERPRILKPPGLDEEPPGLHVRESRWDAGLLGGGVGEGSARNHEHDRGQSTRQ